MQHVNIIDGIVEVDVIAIVNDLIAEEIGISDEKDEDSIQKYIKNKPLAEIRPYEQSLTNRMMKRMREIWDKYSQYPIYLKGSGKCFKNKNKSGDILFIEGEAINIEKDYIEKLSGKYR